MKAALYARVSTMDKEQNPEVQLDKLRAYCRDMEWEVYREYVDRVSAADLVKRTAWAQLMKDAAVRRFHALLVWQLDRAFRSVVHATTTIGMLRGYNVGFRSYMEPAVDTTTPTGEFVFNITAAWAQLERQLIGQRVRAGIDYAREHGTKSGLAIGRPPLNIPALRVYDALRRHDSVVSAARELSQEFGTVSRPYIYRVCAAQGWDAKELVGSG